jgi:hypothetical protein
VEKWAKNIILLPHLTVNQDSFDLVMTFVYSNEVSEKLNTALQGDGNGIHSAVINWNY